MLCSVQICHSYHNQSWLMCVYRNFPAVIDGVVPGDDAWDHPLCYTRDLCNESNLYLSYLFITLTTPHLFITCLYDIELQKIIPCSSNIIKIKPTDAANTGFTTVEASTSRIRQSRIFGRLQSSNELQLAGGGGPSDTNETRYGIGKIANTHRLENKKPQTN